MTEETILETRDKVQSAIDRMMDEVRSIGRQLEVNNISGLAGLQKDEKWYESIRHALRIKTRQLAKLEGLLSVFRAEEISEDEVLKIVNVALFASIARAADEAISELPDDKIKEFKLDALDEELDKLDKSFPGFFPK